MQVIVQVLSARGNHLPARLLPRRSDPAVSMRAALLSGGVGGARLARGFELLSGVDVTVIVNVGDDETVYGLSVSPDLDTVLYTLAGVEGKAGWGRAGDTMILMERLAEWGVDTAFRVGDSDAALNLYRTMRLRAGDPLHEITASLAERMGVRSRLLPATNDRLATEIETASGERISFQEYFVRRGHRDRVAAVRYLGADEARAAPGVVEAVRSADLVVIGPSNPPLSIWPILAVRDIARAVAGAERVTAVSPLFGGRALKGPAHRVMAALGLPEGNRGVAAAYRGLLSRLVIDEGDAADAPALAEEGLPTLTADARIAAPEAAAALARKLLDAL